MIIPFSPPDIREEEIKNVIEVLKSGWITTGPKTKEFERKISEYCGTEKAICFEYSDSWIRNGSKNTRRWRRR